MKKYGEKEIKIIRQINNIMEYIQDENDWLEIAYSISTSETDNIEVKIEKILEIIIAKNKKLYEYSDNFWCNLHELL